MPMRNYNINAVVLKAVNIKDSDKIYIFLSRELGKISVLGKGVRKISSRRGGNLDTLNLISAKITENSAGYKQVNEVKTLNSFRELKKSLELSQLAYYMAEMVYRNVEEGVDSEDLFVLLAYCLNKLSEQKRDPKEVISFFELRFMKALGYDLGTDFCVKCGSQIEDSLSKYTFVADRGGFYCKNCSGFGREIPGEVFKWLKEAKSLDLMKVQVVADLKMANVVLKEFIGRHLDSKMKSLELNTK